MTATHIPPDTLRAAFGQFPSGVTAICANRDGLPVGMAMSTFVPVSLEPPLVAVCVQRSSRTWPVLRSLARLGVSVLAENHGESARALAARNGDRFQAVTHESTQSGAIRIADSLAYFECSVAEEFTAGDHLLALLQVHDLDTAAGHSPLVFHRSTFGRLATS